MGQLRPVDTGSPQSGVSPMVTPLGSRGHTWGAVVSFGRTDSRQTVQHGRTQGMAAAVSPTWGPTQSSQLARWGEAPTPLPHGTSGHGHPRVLSESRCA